MRVLVVGAGATGGYYGGRLAEAGRDVTFLLRERRAAEVRAEGLRIVSPLGDALLHPAVLTAEELRAAPAIFDLVVISVKAYSLESALPDIAPAIGPDTLLLPILNGMRHLDTLVSRYGAQRVLAGSVRIIADVNAAGAVEQQNRLCGLTIGFLSSGRQGSAVTMDELRATLEVPGIDLTVAPDAVDAMWQKWWLLASLNVVCILAEGTVGEVVRSPGGERFAHAALDECLAVAAANGHPADPVREAEIRERFSDPGAAMTSSMFRDLSRGLPVEADQILGDLIARAGSVPVPLLRAAYVRLKVYEARRQAV